MFPSSIGRCRLSRLILSAVFTLSSFSFNAQAAPKSSSAADSSAGCEKIRAGLDVGSSETKMAVVKINVCKQFVVEVIFPKKGDKDQEKQARAPLNFKQDLESVVDEAQNAEANGQRIEWKDYPRFSTGMQARAESELERLANLARTHGAEDIVGVATQAFRESRNADYITGYIAQKNRMTLMVPTPAQEALIEWMSATMDKDTLKEDSPVGIATIGIGAGSMQIGSKGKDGSFASFPSTLASENMYDKSVKLLRGTGNLLPIETAADMDQLVKMAATEVGNASSTVKDRVGLLRVVGVGGVINKSIKAILTNILKTERNFFTDTDISKAVAAVVGKSADDAEVFKDFPPDRPELKELAISNLALVAGVMQGLGIQKIWYSKVTNTTGALFTKEFGIKMTWKKSTEDSDLVQKKKADRRIAAAKASGGDALAVAREELKAAPSKKLDTSINTDSGTSGTDENRSICDSVPQKTVKGDVCTIINPCMPTSNFCSNKAEVEKDSNKKCVVRGRTTLVYDMCNKGQK